jgi:hypothetical protein
MIRAHLRMVHSPDIPDLATYAPENPSHFSLLVQAIIGPLADEGAESFDFIVCSPAWVAEAMAKEKAVFGKGLLMMEYYHFPTLESAIQQLCERTWGETWYDVAQKLSRYGGWEFDSYLE